MAKKLVAQIKLQIPAGKANPSPPIGPALGQRGVNIMEFCKAFNAATASTEPGLVTPVLINVYADKSFDFVLKSPPASVLLLRAASVSKGSGVPNTTKVGRVTHKQLLDIAKVKTKELTAKDEAAAIRTIAGTARSMGIEVEGE